MPNNVSIWYFFSLRYLTSSPEATHVCVVSECITAEAALHKEDISPHPEKPTDMVWISGKNTTQTLSWWAFSGMSNPEKAPWKTFDTLEKIYSSAEKLKSLGVLAVPETGINYCLYSMWSAYEWIWEHKGVILKIVFQ